MVKDTKAICSTLLETMRIPYLRSKSTIFLPAKIPVTRNIHLGLSSSIPFLALLGGNTLLRSAEMRMPSNDESTGPGLAQRVYICREAASGDSKTKQRYIPTILNKPARQRSSSLQSIRSLCGSRRTCSSRYQRCLSGSRGETGRPEPPASLFSHC